MNLKNAQVVVDEKGRRAGVLLGMREYQRLLNELDELDAIRAFDRAKRARGRAVPLVQALATVERGRK